jgi:hypothetical protein
MNDSAVLHSAPYSDRELSASAYFRGAATCRNVVSISLVLLVSFKIRSNARMATL